MLKKATSALLAVGAIATVSLATGANASATGSHYSCVDGTNRDNFTHTWDGYSKITVATKDGKKLCEDTQFYFSSFVMPDTWDGNGFNETAVPQTKHDATSATLAAGQYNPSATLEVSMPDDCKNVQTDLYFAPEQTEVTWENRIGDRLIAAKHKKAVSECEVPPVEEECPEEKPETPVEEPETPVEEPETPIEEPEVPAEEPEEVLGDSTETPVEIPKTGLAGSLGALIALAGAASTYAAVYRTRK